LLELVELVELTIEPVPATVPAAAVADVAGRRQAPTTFSNAEVKLFKTLREMSEK